MARKRTATIKTVRENISHIRKQIDRLKKMKTTASPSGKTFKIRRQGSRLIIDGKVYKPKDLDALAGKSGEFQLEAIAWLEEKLKFEETRKIKMTGKKGKITGLSELGVKHALEGKDRLTDPELAKFETWLNTGSEGWKKNEYYHIYGADKITKEDVLEFVLSKGYKTVEELITNEP